MYIEYFLYISGRDAAAVLFEALRQPHASYLCPSDFRQFLRMILDTHPGLAFLNNTPEFQDRYLETVLVRIYYNAPRGYSGTFAFLFFFSLTLILCPSLKVK